MEHTIELRIPSMLRILADLGRHQVTRLVAQTLFDLRQSGEDENDRNWFDAEKINNQMFWDDLMGIVTRDDPEGTERVVRHIYYYRQELSRVVAIPGAPLASAVVLVEPEKGQKLVAGSRIVCDVGLELRPVTINLGLETSRSIPAPAEFHAAALDVHLTGLSDMAYDAIAPETLKAGWEQSPVHYDEMDVRIQNGPSETGSGARKIFLEAGSCGPGTYLVHFSTDMTLTTTILPVLEYPRIDDGVARTEERRVTSNHAARIRVV
ncbi:MAG TPA: hypothetical protein PLM00_05140 [Spirochaetota bacterium]|nr:hypothetical protein [Spirochaetota bacterium]HPH04184.1 hypothetical protein [Spirochaetota bacterium]HPN82754.1 hypothetical protein [Spirochaetota bacterium]